MAKVNTADSKGFSVSFQSQYKRLRKSVFIKDFEINDERNLLINKSFASTEKYYIIDMDNIISKLYETDKSYIPISLMRTIGIIFNHYHNQELNRTNDLEKVLLKSIFRDNIKYEHAKLILTEMIEGSRKYFKDLKIDIHKLNIHNPLFSFFNNLLSGIKELMDERIPTFNFDFEIVKIYTSDVLPKELRADYLEQYRHYFNKQKEVSTPNNLVNNDKISELLDQVTKIEKPKLKRLKYFELENGKYSMNNHNYSDFYSACSKVLNMNGPFLRNKLQELDIFDFSDIVYDTFIRYGNNKRIKSRKVNKNLSDEIRKIINLAEGKVS